MIFQGMWRAYILKHKIDPLTQSLYPLRVPSEQTLPYNTEKCTGEQSAILFEKWMYFGR